MQEKKIKINPQKTIYEMLQARKIVAGHNKSFTRIRFRYGTVEHKAQKIIHCSFYGLASSASD